MGVDASDVGDNGGLMAASSTPSRTPVVLTLLAAALIGFHVGALVATTRDGADTVATGGAAAKPTPSTSVATPSPTPTPTPTSTATVDATLTLAADRSTASTQELIRLTGTLDPPQGTVLLQVQQSVDGMGFLDFPVTTMTLPDGSFGLWVRTRRVGTSEFRVLAYLEGTKVASNAVSVQIS